MEYTINWNVPNKITATFCVILHIVSSKITCFFIVFFSLMYRGTTLLYRQEVLVCTKSITRIKTKGGSILRLTEGHKPPRGPSYLKVYLRSISPTYSMCWLCHSVVCLAIMSFGPRGSNPLSYHGGQLVHQLKQLGTPLR